MDPTGNTVALRMIIIVILLALSAYFSSAETSAFSSSSVSCSYLSLPLQKD